MKWLQARTSALFQLDCGELGTRTQPGQAVYGLEHSNGGLITFPGGVALRSDQAPTLAGWLSTL